MYFAPEALDSKVFFEALTSENGLRVIFGIWADEVLFVLHFSFFSFFSIPSDIGGVRVGLGLL